MKILLRVFLVIAVVAYLAACDLLGAAAGSLCVLPLCAVNLLNEKRLTLNQLAQQEGVNTSTTWRWALRGVRGVKLETFSVGARRFTTHEAFARFVSGTTAAAQSGQQPPTSRANRQRASAQAAANRGLEKHGV